MEIFGFSVPHGSSIFFAAAIFIVGLLFITKGGDWFVDSASFLAEATGIPKFVIGATIVSVATTLPELLVSARAAAAGANQMAIGNAVGSVTANTALIMGISLSVLPSVVNRKSFSFRSSLLLLSGILLWILSSRGFLPRWSAFILWGIFIVFVADNLIEGKKCAEQPSAIHKAEKKDFLNKTAFFVIGALAIVIGAEFLVSSGRVIASKLGISENIVGFTIVAVGTSLPELVTTLTALRKKEASLSVGNIIGANIIDLTLILPLCSFLNRGGALPVDKVSLIFDFPVCVAACGVAVIPTLITGKLKRSQGIILLGIYAAYIVFLILNETGALSISL
ncbi:MAG: calcium/sodium antiporter [Oscillospiraceae bacterium]|nr:calcium/sodium antiporter [Oscillospiraceae bacterium]